MTWRLHDLIVASQWSGAGLGQRLRATVASRPQADGVVPDLNISLAVAAAVPDAPPGEPHFRQDDLLAYYLDGDHAVTAHFPRFGQLCLDLHAGRTEVALTPAALAMPGVFEDLLAIGLSPHLRRRGLFLLHAFAARPPGGPAVLLVGDIGAGKTTTGLALLHAGWQLLSNDSPMLRAAVAGPGVEVLAYPGLLSAYPDTLARFPELARLNTARATRQKRLFAAEAVYPGVWAASAPAGAIVYPQIEPRAEHAIQPLPAPEALRLILPHAIEQWDRALIPPHLALLTQLVQSVPAYRLRLAPQTDTLASLITTVLEYPTRF
jgi:hypothetical protein